MTALPAFAEGEIAIDETNFLDKNFRNYVSELDGDHNDSLSQEELDAVTSIDVHEKGISDLTGVEHFTNLKELNCSGNQLTSLDVSQNTNLETLDCFDNQLTNLDVSKNPNLVGLYCKGNQLKTLDVSSNANLNKLYCEENNISDLTIGQNVNL